MKTKIFIFRVPMRAKRKIIFERDLQRAGLDAVASPLASDRYNAARRVERLTERMAAIYADA